MKQPHWTQDSRIKPFSIDWSQQAIEQLKQTLAASKIPHTPEGCGWTLGCDPVFLEKFRDYWINNYDFAQAQANLNRYPQYLVDIDDLQIHLVHVPGEGSNNRPLLITHGWPGSHFELWGVVERLANPSRFGGDAKDAFDVYLPTLPGYGYSSKPKKVIGPMETAKIWHRIMTEYLGIDQYLVQGGDWGSMIASYLGVQFSDHVKAIHITLFALRPSAPAQNAEEQAWIDRGTHVSRIYGGYSAVQVFKPVSLGYMAINNPLGQAAWILERFHDWSDLRDCTLDERFGMDALITNIMMYVMTDSLATSVWFYNGHMQDQIANGGKPVYCKTPTGYAVFPNDILMPPPPKSRVELSYNLVHWTEHEGGGHFVSMESPNEYLADVFKWAQLVWPT